MVIDIETTDAEGRLYIAMDLAGGRDETAMVFFRQAMSGPLTLADFVKVNGDDAMPDLWWNAFMMWFASLTEYVREPVQWPRSYRRAAICILPISLPIWLAAGLILALGLNAISMIETVVWGVIEARSYARNIWTEPGQSYKHFIGDYR